MIKIIAGVFGYRNPNTGLLEAKDVNSEPFEIVPVKGGRTEQDLVNLGVAEFVAPKEKVAPVQQPKPAKSDKKAKKAQDEVKANEEVKTDEEGPVLTAADPE